MKDFLITEGDKQLFNIAIDEYLKLKDSSIYGEQYKYDILGKLNEQLDVTKINPGNVKKFASLLKKENPQSGSFVNWRDTDALLDFAEKEPETLSELLTNLFDDSRDLPERINEFRDEAKNFNSDVSWGTPLVGYILAAFDKEKYVIYKDGIFHEVAKWFSKIEVPSDIGEKYQAFIELCNFLKGYFKDNNYLDNPEVLDGQDFLYSVSFYKALRFRIFVKNFYEIVVKTTYYKQHIDEYIEKIKSLDRSYLERKKEELKNSDYTNKIRFLVLERILDKNKTLDVEILDRIKKEVAREYEEESWKPYSNSNILFKIFLDYFNNKRLNYFLSETHRILKEYVKKNAEYIIPVLDYKWRKNFATEFIWVPIFPEGVRHFTDGALLILNIESNEVKYGLRIGEHIEDKTEYENDYDIEEDVDRVTLSRVGDKFLEVIDKFNETNKQILESKEKEKINYWRILPGKNAKYWDLWQENNFIALGWERVNPEVDDLEKEIEDKYPERDSNHILREFDYFLNEVSTGDICIVYGHGQILNAAKVTSEYYYDKEEKPDNKNKRDVEWLLDEPVDATKFGEDFFNKLKHRYTLIAVEEDEYIDIIENKILKKETLVEPEHYFWITANPKIWKVEKIKGGGSVFYTAYNEKGNKRRIFSNFEKAQPGDKVIFYESTPVKEIVALGEITEGLHKEEARGYDNPVDGISIRYLEDINPISWSNLCGVKELENSAPVKNGAQGSLFKLTKEEYENLLALEEIIEEHQIISWGDVIEGYSYDLERKFKVQNLHFPDKQKEDLERNISEAIRIGKHIILIGPPGTGKSKLAKEICEFYTGGEENYLMSTATSDWSTFDTIGGYHPDDEGSLLFKSGIFLKCFKEQNTYKTRNRWLIIDEINRADIDKAFGSLFSALTGDNVKIPFEMEDRTLEVIGNPNSDTRISDNCFIIHPDWRIIATMNTFDKASLYEMSYAFMRRFAFVPVEIPAAINDDLIKNYLNIWTEKSKVNDDIVKKLTSIWKTINKTRKIGPAIVEDMYKYVNKTENDDYTGAIIMFVLPQFEGLVEDKIIDFVKSLKIANKKRLSDFCSDFFGIERKRFEKAESIEE